jgi:hypothetical protein
VSAESVLPMGSGSPNSPDGAGLDTGDTGIRLAVVNG